MSNLFLHLLNISITAGWIVLVVVLLRFVLKKAPKWIRVVLWGLVALRLMLPVSIESVTSLVPSAETVHVEPVTYTIIRDSDPHPLPVEGEQIVLQSGFSALNSVVNPVMEQATAKHVDTVTMLKTVAGWVWLAGVCGMLLYSLISFLRLRHRVRASVALEKGVYVCDEISDPFILGLIVPKIYLPSGMDEQTRAYVLSHERAHLRRFDFIWKPLGFLLLSIYWFNPLLWLAYLLLCRDIELACDEKVVKELDDAGKAAYSEALVHASVSRRMVSACPLAFGEVGVKSRVKSILNYKKPAFWIILVALLAIIVTGVCFLTVPKKTASAYAPIRFEEAAAAFIENDDALTEESFYDLSNSIRVLHNCGIVPYSRIDSVISITEDTGVRDSSDFLIHLYVMECSCKNVCFTITFYKEKEAGTLYGSMLILGRITGDHFDYVRESHRTGRTKREDLTNLIEAARQKSFTLLEEHCGITEEEAIRLMEEFDLLNNEEVIDLYDIESIEQSERDRDTISLSLTTNFSDPYTVVISTVNRPIILSIIDSNGKILYESEEKEFPFAVPKASPVPSDKVVQWLDYYSASDQTSWEETKEIAIDAFPNIRFRWTSGSVEAVENGRRRTLFSGMPVWSVFFADVTNDGKPELCATVSFGSGIVDNHIVVYDYANRQNYTLWDRGEFDYQLSAVDGKLQVNKRLYNNSTVLLLDTGTLTMHEGVPCCLWQSDGSFTPLNRGLHESKLTGEWLVEEETDSDGNVLYTFALGDLWKEYNFKPDGTAVYNETIPVSSDYEKAFGHPVEYAYEVYDDHVFIKGERSINGYLDPLTGKLKLNYQPSPGQYVYQTLRRMGEDLPETDAQASPAPVSDTTSPFDQSQYHKTVPVGEVPEALRSVVARDLFCAGYLNGGKLIPYEDRVLSYREATDGDTTAAIFDLYDLYGNLLTHAEVILDPYQTVESAEATADGGIVFASGFYEVQLSDRSWASEHTDVVSYIVKLDASGRQLWKTALPNVNGYALHLCIESNDAYYFFGNWETPEIRRPGVSSYTDLYLLKIGTDGSILKEQTYGGSDFDMLWTVDICAEGFVMDAWIQSTDGDFPADSAWRIVVNHDLMIVEKQQIAVPRLADYVGTVDGKRFYDDDLRFSFYPDGYVHAILDYGTFYLIVSENNTGVYDSQPLFINSIWYLTETVYAAYDKQNNLLWKAAVDSSPDYDSEVKQYTSEP